MKNKLRRPNHTKATRSQHIIGLDYRPRLLQIIDNRKSSISPDVRCSLRQRSNTRKHGLRGSRHIQPTIFLAPIDTQVASGQGDDAVSVRSVCEHRGHDDRAGACAASQRRTRPPLPHLHQQVRPGHDLWQSDSIGRK